MSSDPSNQVMTLFKQLLKQLDTKFSSLEQQLDKIEANIDNLRAYNERYQNQINNEIKSLKDAISENLGQRDKLLSTQLEFDQLTEPPEEKFKTSSILPPSPPDLKPLLTPASTSPEPPFPLPSSPPPPVNKNLSQTSDLSGGLSELKSLGEEYINEMEQLMEVKKPRSTIESQYGGMKETPILEALKEEGLSDQTISGAQKKKKKVQKETLMSYLERLEKIVRGALPQTETYLNNEEYPNFIDKGLTVVHGIIEFLFVAYRLEFPDSNLDYFAKAKNLSGQGLFKDYSLLEKLESLYNQIERNEKPMLARPLMHGLNERILKLNEDFISKLPDAYNRL